MRKILATALFLAASTSRGVLANEDTQCKFWTDKDVYERNANLKEKNDSYDKAIHSLVEQECLEPGTNERQSCRIDLKDVNDEEQLAAYAFECTEGGGILWVCDYWPQCGDSDVSMEIESVMVCASPKCQDVSSLIPHADLLGPLNEEATVCASMFACTPTGDVDPKALVGEHSTIDALPQEEDSAAMTAVPIIDIGDITGGDNGQQATDSTSSNGAHLAFWGEATYGKLCMSILLGFVVAAI